MTHVHQERSPLLEALPLDNKGLSNKGKTSVTLREVRNFP